MDNLPDMPNTPFKAAIMSFITKLLKKPGDVIEARVTNNNRKVLKIKSDDTKYSATQYPNGTIVETKTTRPKKE